MPFLEDKRNVRIGTTEAISTPKEASLKPTSHAPLNADSEQMLVVSPYTEEAHRLDLKATELAQGLLAKALKQMEPTRVDYATASYCESFNWGEVVRALKGIVAAADFYWSPRTFFVVGTSFWSISLSWVCLDL